LKAPTVLLPDETIDLKKWAVVACDQYTAQPEYWESVCALVGDAPSALNIIYPEAWLHQGDGRIAGVNRAMEEYRASVLTRRIEGFILMEREISAGNRLGLIAAVDLEQYDYGADSKSLIRATEGTILERIPPRVRIRENAALESPHVLMLVDDPDQTLIEPVHAARDRLEPLYDFDLMLGGGRVRGWRVDGAAQAVMLAALARLNERARGLLYAVGDGNHSLAAAKAHWRALRETLPECERADHLARYALVEIGNLHDSSLVFEPIHRVLSGVGAEALFRALREWLRGRGMDLADASGGGIMFSLVGDGVRPLRIDPIDRSLPLSILQEFLDVYLCNHPGVEIDYVHGDDVAFGLAGENSCSLLLKPSEKANLFESVRAGGALPRKAFSMGEAREKRYYLECREIR